MPKKRIVLSLAALAVLMGSAAAQSASSLFDERKAERELEIMEGIIQTTLKYVTSEKQEDVVLALENDQVGFFPLGGSSVSGFYLYDQGAVFVVSLPGVRTLRTLGDARAYAEIAQGYVVGSQSSDEKKGKVSTTISRDKLLELQEKVKQKQSQWEEEAEEHRKRLEEVKGYLVEALANHGDSLTVVQDDEYINLILKSPQGWPTTYIRSDRNRTEYVSVKKSWISDYKAGRLTLEQFKQKALSY